MARGSLHEPRSDHSRHARRLPAGTIVGRVRERQLRQHVRADPGGDLRAARLHQRPVPRSGAGRRGARSARRRWPTTISSTSPRRRRRSRAGTRVLAGQPSASLLWINLAAKTFPDQYDAPLRAMPLDPEPALTADELEAVRLWIKPARRAPASSPGPAELLDACLPPPEPIEIKPLPPPAPGTGVQIGMPRWVLDAQSEARGVLRQLLRRHRSGARRSCARPNGTFRYKFHQTRQDRAEPPHGPDSVRGRGAAEQPAVGRPSAAVGGARDGRVLRSDRRPASAVTAAICATAPSESVACIGYGPGDGGIGLSTGRHLDHAADGGRVPLSRRASTASCR